MELINIDFTKTPKLLINGEEYSFSNKFNGSDHLYNNAGSQLNLKNVYPIGYNTDNLFSKPFRPPKYSLCELYFGDKLFYFGVLVNANKGSLKPTKPKNIDINIVSLKELLILSPIDFVISRQKASYVVNKIINKLGISYVKIGKLSFTDDVMINAYNFKDMTAWDSLKYIERQTNSTLSIKFDSTTKSIMVNFYSRDSIKSSSIGDKGVDIPFDTEENAKAFEALYQLEEIEWSENTSKDANVIRVESEKTVSTRSTKLEIDLSLNNKTIILPYPVAKIDTKKTILYEIVPISEQYPEGKKRIRPLSINTQEKADEGKPTDISYTIGETSLNINGRIFTNYQQARLDIWYFRELRQSIDFEDINDQNRIKSQLKTSNGKKFRYEKYNDMTSLADLGNAGKHLLELGTAEKVELKITSHNPIWSLGQHVNFEVGNVYEEYKEFAGEYIVKEVSIDFTVGNDGLEYAKFIYTLSDIKLTETLLNFYDSQAYRDNPVSDAEDIQITLPYTLADSLQLIVENEVQECKDFETPQFELDEELDADMGIDSGVQETYKVWRI